MTQLVTRDWSLLPHSHYSIVYLDPPWNYYGSPDKDQAAGKHYSLMSLDDIIALPIASIMAKRSIVLCWATCPKLDIAIDAIRGWGLQYRGVLKNWVKTRLDGSPINGAGVRPTTTKPTSELLFVASRQKKGRPLPILDEGMAQVAMEPRGAHSEKPACIRNDIVTLFGDVPRIELFARKIFPGWDAWGNQVPEPGNEKEINHE
jgi:N6-adenosine-specific RNA methylase IME4